MHDTNIQIEFSIPAPRYIFVLSNSPICSSEVKFVLRFEVSALMRYTYSTFELNQLKTNRPKVLSVFDAVYEPNVKRRNMNNGPNTYFMLFHLFHAEYIME